MTLNAALAGLVAITAGCDAVSVTGAAIIGVVAGLLLPISVNFFDSVLKIDDPVGAISVHGVCGATGTLLTGLLAVDGGVFYGGGFRFFGIQCLGVAVTALWAAVMITIVFLILKNTIGLRVSAEEELKGLDITEHGLPSAYGGFAMAYDDTPADLEVPEGAVPVQESVPVEVVTPVEAPVTSDGVKMTKIDILCKMERFDALKRAMFDIGITGMTAINVMGCGEQRGKTEGYFRGAKVEATMLPSIQVSIVVCKLPVSLVVNTAKKILYTGHYGDGKIFIYNVENVVKVRTGEQGYDALQDDEQA
jgi:Amt family ammonium transporter